MNVHANISLIKQVSDTLREMLGDEFDAETFWDTLDGETDAMDVIGRLLRERNEATAMAAATKEVADSYATRAKRLQARDAAVKKALGQILDAVGEAKVVHPLGTVSRTTPRESVEIVSETDIPSQLCKTTVAPDKTAIKKALEQGEDVPGARLKVGESGVMVRVK